MLKKFTLVMAALVGAALVLIGCEQEAETEYVTRTEVIQEKYVITSGEGAEAALTGYLAEGGDFAVGVYVGVDLTGDLTVPAGKIIQLHGATTFDAASSALTVNGKVYVYHGATLKALGSGKVVIPDSGSVIVRQGGTLSVASPVSVNDGAEEAETVLGTKVSFTETSELAITGALADAAALTAALGYLSAGTLSVTAGVKPSEVAAAVAEKLSADKTLVITTTGSEDSTGTLDVPAYVSLTTSDDLDTVTTLTVTGALAASSATLAALTTLTVNGDLTVPGGAAAKVAPATGTGNITVSTAASLSAAATFTFSGVITFGDTFATSASSPGVVFNGTVVFGGNVTLTAAPVTFGGTAFFADEAVVTLTTAASIITLKDGAGALAAGVPVDNVPDIYHKVIQADAGNDVTLTPAVNTTLTFGNGGITQGASGSNAHGITIGKAARLIPGAAYTVASAENKIGTLTVDTGSTLTIGAGALANESFGGVPSVSARLVLTGATGSNGAKLTGAGSVVAGGTTIVGGTNGWQAVDTSGASTVTIEADTITASADTTALTAVTGDTQPSITVAAGATLAIAADTTIDLLGSGAKVGSIVLKGAASGTDGGTLAFAKGTTSIVKTANSGGSGNNTAIENAAIGAGLTVYDSGASNYYLVSITSKDDNNAHTIQANIEATDVTLDGLTVAGSAA